ncbi:unnamed protein product [Vitrella brassicaformis CCMP3155]|uniref:Apple domain-containing protein n=3 Tax=Vitrella brassicaformis TaxID=1169539 RepID=A0A0G4G2P6_VITBC|nr:unnamed protein product [Vitrella brassicaformis CCMP3155]|eukprot:CEM22550.1 unnamed protein product [Vitrella brassicaformis CCMP3155]
MKPMRVLECLVTLSPLLLSPALAADGLLRNADVESPEGRVLRQKAVNAKLQAIGDKEKADVEHDEPLLGSQAETEGSKKKDGYEADYKETDEKAKNGTTAQQPKKVRPMQGGRERPADYDYDKEEENYDDLDIPLNTTYVYDPKKYELPKSIVYEDEDEDDDDDTPLPKEDPAIQIDTDLAQSEDCWTWGMIDFKGNTRPATDEATAAASPRDCMFACRADPQCLRWTFTEDPRNCTLKGTAKGDPIIATKDVVMNSKVVHGGVNSVNCIKGAGCWTYGVNTTAADLPAEHVDIEILSKITNVAQCASFCDSTTKCLSFAYAPGQGCRLKGEAPDLEKITVADDSGAVVGGKPSLCTRRSQAAGEELTRYCKCLSPSAANATEAECKRWGKGGRFAEEAKVNHKVSVTYEGVLIGEDSITLSAAEIHDLSPAYLQCQRLCSDMDGEGGRERCQAFSVEGRRAPSVDTFISTECKLWSHVVEARGCGTSFLDCYSGVMCERAPLNDWPPSTEGDSYAMLVEAERAKRRRSNARWMYVEGEDLDDSRKYVTHRR